MRYLAEVIARCRGSVHLTVNDHTTGYQTVNDYIGMMLATEQISKDEVSDELRKALVSSGTIYDLAFYPDNPVGSYRVFGTSVEEVVESALEILHQQEGREP